VRAHHQVRVPVAAGIGAVGADAADLGREVEDELRVAVAEEPLGVVAPRQVVVAPPRREDLVAPLLEPLDEVRAEEAYAAGDEDAAQRTAADWAAAGAGFSQSTRPSQRARFSAYQRIVRINN
jgi:hypothetical protein